ncbi:serine hydrolase domain-containing protein [Bradyrhizobium ottawaense]|uniref:serine hydrolase domain-containing protein n=1 Tax=Bradyrhizobium ottawaense TaxID=931866 RepID=UPI0038324DA6
MDDMKVTAIGYEFRAAHAAMQRYVDQNLLAGFSSAVLISRELADVTCIGWADKEAGIPLRIDHIFRVFSNTKLITSCAALLLFEEGRFQLDDPIERFIPQLANRRVLRPDASTLQQSEAAIRPITIRHLMSHSSGLSYGLLDPGTLIFNAYKERKVINPATTLGEMMDVLADLPLIFHPGSSWEYSIATDVLARLVEVISGERFDAFLQSRILGPLGMADTGFVASDPDRLVAYYAGADRFDPTKLGLVRLDDAPYPGAYRRLFPRQNGGSGLVSTLPDMLALIRSLLPGGPTLLKPDTIRLMMTNQLPEGVWIRFPGYGELQGKGHGLAGALTLEPSAFDHPNARGELFWGGRGGTQWWISPKSNIAGLIMTQREMGHPFVVEFKRLAYEAIKRES